MHEVGRHTLPLALKCWLGTMRDPLWALWDTGSTWSVIGPSLAEALEDDLGPPEDEVTILTRDGAKPGLLRRLRVSFRPAHGRPLEIEATVLTLADEWQRPPVLGVRGFMERIRFAVDLGSGIGNEALIALAPQSHE